MAFRKGTIRKDFPKKIGRSFAKKQEQPIFGQAHISEEWLSMVRSSIMTSMSLF